MFFDLVKSHLPLLRVRTLHRQFQLCISAIQHTSHDASQRVHNQKLSFMENHSNHVRLIRLLVNNQEGGKIHRRTIKPGGRSPARAGER